MKTTLILCAAFLATSAHAFAHMPADSQTPRTAATPRTPTTAVTPQTPAPTAAPPAAPTAPAPPAPVAVAPPPPPPAPPAPPAPPTPRQAINVKVDLTITEEGGGGPLVKKTVSAVAADGFNASVREVAMAQAKDPVPLNLDAFPAILANGKIRLQCSVQYLSAQARDSETRARTDIKQNFVLILDSGKTQVVTQATDPVTDRKVTVEVMATILR